MCKSNIFIGFIKVGPKHLFIYDEIGQISELNPLCVLDFYVYEKCQRSGNGKKIFSEMIKNERIEPRKMGYDRPSIKFINFLKKHYNLWDYVQQNNNYIVFKDYFIDAYAPRDKYDIYGNIKQLRENSYNYNRQIDNYNRSNNQNSMNLEANQKDNVDFKLYKEFGDHNPQKKESNKENPENKNFHFQNKNSNKKSYENYAADQYLEKLNMPKKKNRQYQCSSSDYGAFFNYGY